MRSSFKVILGWAGGISILFYSLDNAAIALQEPRVRVMLLEDRQLRFRSDGIRTFSIKGINSPKKKIKGIKFKIKNNAGYFAIDSYPEQWILMDSQSKVRIHSLDPRGLWLNKRRYRGELRVFIDRDSFKVVNHIKIEKYLKSVVGSEMPKTWPIEALKAQAVAARTYALQQIGKKDKYDINSNVSSQVYLGVEAETSKTINAVNATRSLVLLFNGKLINAVFHSSSGGKTENSGSVWKYQMPYLISVPDYDKNSPKFRWNESFTDVDLEKFFPEIGGVKSIDIIKKSKTGRILTAKVSGPKGILILNGKEIRRRMSLKSTLAKFSFLMNKYDEVNRYSNKTLVGKALHINQAKIKKRIGINDLLKLPPPITLDPARYTLLVEGYGSGHGVGMSQWGAYAMAKRGFNFKQILKHYYRGVKIMPY